VPDLECKGRQKTVGRESSTTYVVPSRPESDVVRCMTFQRLGDVKLTVIDQDDA